MLFWKSRYGCSFRQSTSTCSSGTPMALRNKLYPKRVTCLRWPGPPRLCRSCQCFCAMQGGKCGSSRESSSDSRMGNGTTDPGCRCAPPRAASDCAAARTAEERCSKWSRVRRGTAAGSVENQFSAHSRSANLTWRPNFAFAMRASWGARTTTLPRTKSTRRDFSAPATSPRYGSRRTYISCGEETKVPSAARASANASFTRLSSCSDDVPWRSSGSAASETAAEKPSLGCAVFAGANWLGQRWRSPSRVGSSCIGAAPPRGGDAPRIRRETSSAVAVSAPTKRASCSDVCEAHLRLKSSTSFFRNHFQTMWRSSASRTMAHACRMVQCDQASSSAASKSPAAPM
mmetsp:Transcript_8702/g.30500  ORF Transcript_8702/g.30500 Transcript_8702/m.30500 type:complete len:345 (+) Transcript_8702:364-1398(+)